MGADLGVKLKASVIGQDHVIDALLPHFDVWDAGLEPEGRPAGIFLFLGSTGSGKTFLAEMIAEALHGNPKNILRINCAEFQLEHEITKITGAPPSYLGHRETRPLLSEQALKGITSPNCALSIVLFDEIEKAAHTLGKLLLGIMDKAILKLGDNTTVNFEKSIIIMTSNLGAGEMSKLKRQKFNMVAPEICTDRLKERAFHALRKKYTPEFVNRIDAMLVFNPLTLENGKEIARLELRKMKAYVALRKGAQFVGVEWTPEVEEYLGQMVLDLDTGARELKRVIFQKVLRPLASMFVEGGRVNAYVTVEGGEIRVVRVQIAEEAA